MGRRKIKISFKQQITNLVNENRTLFEQKANILTFDQFCKWFGKEFFPLECLYAFRQHLAGCGIICKKDTSIKNNWSRGVCM
jgi:hypothetical protein